MHDLPADAATRPIRMHEECADSSGIARGVEHVAVAYGAHARRRRRASGGGSSRRNRRLSCRVRRRSRSRRESAAGRRRTPCPTRRPFARTNSAGLAMLAPRSGSARRARGCRTPARCAEDMSRRRQIQAARSRGAEDAPRSGRVLACWATPGPFRRPAAVAGGPRWPELRSRRTCAASSLPFSASWPGLSGASRIRSWVWPIGDPLREVLWQRRESMPFRAARAKSPSAAGNATDWLATRCLPAGPAGPRVKRRAVLDFASRAFRSSVRPESARRP